VAGHSTPELDGLGGDAAVGLEAADGLGRDTATEQLLDAAQEGPLIDAHE
jgi:hypothetical protein